MAGVPDKLPEILGLESLTTQPTSPDDVALQADSQTSTKSLIVSEHPGALPDPLVRSVPMPDIPLPRSASQLRSETFMSSKPEPIEQQTSPQLPSPFQLHSPVPPADENIPPALKSYTTLKRQGQQSSIDRDIPCEKRWKPSTPTDTPRLSAQANSDALREAGATRLRWPWNAKPLNPAEKAALPTGWEKFIDEDDYANEAAFLEARDGQKVTGEYRGVVFSCFLNFKSIRRSCTLDLAPKHDMNQLYPH